MTESTITRIGLEDVEPIALPAESWSRMLLTDATVGGIRGSLGYSVFTPGCVLAPVKHEAEELAYVVSGSGEIRTDDGAVRVQAGQAVHIPAGLWHAVANTGSDDLVMVFGFSHPAYPPTERR